MIVPFHTLRVIAHNPNPCLSDPRQSTAAQRRPETTPSNNSGCDMKTSTQSRRRDCSHGILLVSTILVAAFLSVIQPAHSFTTMVPRHHCTSPASTQAVSTSSSSSSSALDCICIHCKHVTNCEAYHFVETKHDQPHMTENPTFTPRDGSPTIHVNIRNARADDETQRMWREHASETEKAQANGDVLVGETKYDLGSHTTMEYDVVGCQDFVQDQDAWVRNMPEEIRLANPYFVPT